MKYILSVYKKHYAAKGSSGIDFLRDAVAFYNTRDEHRNHGRTIIALLSDWAKHVSANN